MISKSSSECTFDQDTFSFSVDGKTKKLILLLERQNLEPATKLLNLFWILVLTKKTLALQCTLSHHRLYKQESTCGYFWKDNKRIHAALEILNYQNKMIKLEKVENVNRGRLSDDKNNFVSSNRYPNSFNIESYET